MAQPSKKRKLLPEPPAPTRPTDESTKPTQDKVDMRASMRRKILVINPNSSKAMTEGLAKLVGDMDPHRNSAFQIDTYTAPSGPSSINNEEDALESANIVIADLKTTSTLARYDAFLVACYSVHPLVGFIRKELAEADLQAHVMGIFEASVSTALSLLPTMRKGYSRRVRGYGNGMPKFGIVSTGKYWEKALTEGVERYLDIADGNNSKRFAGVATTGLDAEQLHTASPDLVNSKMKKAIKKLVLADDVKVICLGCAGMAGMDAIVEEALVEKLGQDRAKTVFVLDGVKAGIGMLETLLVTFPRKE